MSDMAVATLSEIRGDRYLFLVSPEFGDFAQTLPQVFAPVLGKPTRSRKEVAFPQPVLDSLAPLLSTPSLFGPSQEEIATPFEVTAGGAENDAYIHLSSFVEVFDNYADLLSYAQNHKIVIDNSRAFQGVMY